VCRRPGVGKEATRRALAPNRHAERWPAIVSMVAGPAIRPPRPDYRPRALSYTLRRAEAHKVAQTLQSRICEHAFVRYRFTVTAESLIAGKV